MVLAADSVNTPNKVRTTWARVIPAQFKQSPEAEEEKALNTRPMRKSLKESLLPGRTKLGAGSFGEVFKRQAGEPYNMFVAQKVMFGVDELHQPEVVALMKLTHQNVVRYHDYYVERHEAAPSFTILLEYCDLGDLSKPSALRAIQKTLSNAVKEMIVAVAFIHGHDFAHRDIKPANFLLTTGKPGKVIVKLGDFGSAKATQTPTLPSFTQGSPGYIAPEVSTCSTQPINWFHADVFSLGKTLTYVMKKSQGDELSSCQEYLVKAMIVENPEDRRVAQVCLESPYLWTLERQMKFLTHFSGQLHDSSSFKERAQWEKRTKRFPVASTWFSGCLATGPPPDIKAWTGRHKKLIQKAERSSEKASLLVKFLRNTFEHSQDFVREGYFRNRDAIGNHFLRNEFDWMIPEIHNFCLSTPLFRDSENFATFLQYS